MSEITPEIDLAAAQTEIKAVLNDFFELQNDAKFFMSSEIVTPFQKLARIESLLETSLQQESLVKMAWDAKKNIQKFKYTNPRFSTSLVALMGRLDKVINDLGGYQPEQTLSESISEQIAASENLQEEQARLLFTMVRPHLENLLNFVSAYCPKAGTGSVAYERFNMPDQYTAKNLDSLRTDLRALKGFVNTLILTRYSDPDNVLQERLNSIKERLNFFENLCSNPNIAQAQIKTMVAAATNNLFGKSPAKS